MEQKERLDILVERFKEDSVQYRNLEVGESEEEKKVALRSLMNIRMPGKMETSTVLIQDDYLQERMRKIGEVSVEDIPTIKEQGSNHSYGSKLSIWQGDITRIGADAIVNAANSQMLGCFIPMHTCIDNCIHTYAGIQLRAECSQKMNQLRERFGPGYEQPTADPMLTEGYNLPAKKVVHVVGPIVDGFLTKEKEQQLADCYTNTLDMCLDNGLRSVAFCCISTGVFHFPNDRAAAIAVKTVCDWLETHGEQLDRVVFNVFKDEDKKYYEKELF